MLKINDSNQPLLDRAVTYDGAECQTETAPLRGKVLERQLNLLCETMAGHIKSIQSGFSGDHASIQRMVLIFKVSE